MTQPPPLTAPPRALPAHSGFPPCAGMTGAEAARFLPPQERRGLHPVPTAPVHPHPSPLPRGRGDQPAAVCAVAHLDASLRWHDGACVTPAPYAVAPWPRRLVGGGECRLGEGCPNGVGIGVAWLTMAHNGAHRAIAQQGSTPARGAWRSGAGMTALGHEPPRDASAALGMTQPVAPAPPAGPSP